MKSFWGDDKSHEKRAAQPQRHGEEIQSDCEAFDHKANPIHPMLSGRRRAVGLPAGSCLSLIMLSFKNDQSFADAGAARSRRKYLKVRAIAENQPDRGHAAQDNPLHATGQAAGVKPFFCLKSNGRRARPCRNQILSPQMAQIYADELSVHSAQSA